MATTSISEVRICNMALSNIGAKSSIETLGQDDAEANECDLWYHFSRKQALAAYDWNFARRRLTLATATDDPPGVWQYRYQYPSDCVVFRKIDNPAGLAANPIPFEVELSEDRSVKTIITDLDEAVGVYTFDLTDTGLFSEFFVTMLSFALASNIAYALTGKVEIREAMISTFASLSRAAPASNANEQVGGDPKDASWIEIR